MRRTILSLLAPALLSASVAHGAESPAPVSALPSLSMSEPATPRDPGAYADSFLPLKQQVRDYERDPQSRYTYCIRSTAVYECLSYGSDGAIRRTRSRALAHGTGFAYREQGGETFLLTNEHVADWPAVTDAAHKVDDVPSGCKRVSDSLKIVDNEDDDYAADDVPLSRVVSDEVLDAAVVKAKAKLRLLPYRIGRSTLLQTGDVVMVRGFPLGAFQAVNTGKVVNPYDRDQYKDWEHVDFIIDAPLSSGNSGSPVLAVSRRTGEYELVGMFHAGYARATALNAVVGIDQLRDLMMTLRRPVRGKENAEASPGPAQRTALELALLQPSFVPYLSLGPLPVGVRRVGDVLVYEVFSRRFPLDDRRLLVLIDRPAPGAFGTLADAWFGNERGLRRYEAGPAPGNGPVAGDADVGAHLQALLRRLHVLSISTMRFRTSSERAATSRDAMSERATLQRTLQREANGDADLAQVLGELAERLAPRPADEAQSYAALLASLTPPESGSAPAQPAAPQPASPPAAHATQPASPGIHGPAPLPGDDPARPRRPRHRARQ